MEQIATCLGDFRVSTLGRDLGMLCTSPKISQWSKNKPFEAVQNQYGVQTDEQRKLAAYGFHWWNIVRESNAPIATTALSLIEKAKANNGEWIYKKPTSAFRAWDFDGYNHTAEKPYDYLGNNAPIYEPRREFYVGTNTDNSNIEIRLSDMPSIESTYGDGDIIMSTLNLALIYRKKGSNTASVAFAGNIINTLDTQMYSDHIFLQLEKVNNDAVIEYEMVWAATNVVEGMTMDEQFWIYLPNSFQTIQVAAPCYVSWETYPPFEYTASSGYVNTIKFILDATSRLGLGYSYKYVITIWADNYDDRITKTIVGTILDDEIPISPMSGTAEQIHVTIDFGYKSSTDSSWTMMKYDIINNTLGEKESTEADGLTVAYLNNYFNH